jgi:hypothetical protein
MRKFPETIATKQDVENIINYHPNYHDKLKSILLRAANEPEEAEQVTSYDTDSDTQEMINIETKQITRPNQTWERMGFKNRGELNSMIATITKAKAVV